MRLESWRGGGLWRALGDWMITLLVLAIPLVNLFMYLYRAFSKTGNVNRRTFCQACILWFLIILPLLRRPLATIMRRVGRCSTKNGTDRPKGGFDSS